MIVLTLVEWDDLCKTCGMTDRHMEARRYAVDHSISASLPPEEDDSFEFVTKTKTLVTKTKTQPTLLS